ncbi:hypothetical protein C2845_PM06G25410 [Panicum miliaceum]|uniref:SnoaL-like domain-containing protein n=1 Tax=Panicum miliaceum TaxID=4540 RepID=A0A3L6R9V1_PANMI|nr:hypothetical protein C2845_PM06G25410 [Panicum miliaceum]
MTSQQYSIELATKKLDIFDGDAGSCLDGKGGDEVVISSKAVVEELYRVLDRGDVDAVRRLLNPDADRWFHGPRAHQHMVLMRLLTGRGSGGSLPFKIRSLDVFGVTVLAKGTDATGALYWCTRGPWGPWPRHRGARVLQHRARRDEARRRRRHRGASNVSSGGDEGGCVLQDLIRCGRAGCQTRLRETFLASCLLSELII